MDIFSSNLAKKLLDYTKIKNYHINLKYSKHISYNSIYSFELLKIRNFKIYIITSLTKNLSNLSNL